MVFKYEFKETHDIEKESLELEKSLGYKREAAIEKAEHKKPVQHVRHLASGKIVQAGHGVPVQPKDTRSEHQKDLDHIYDVAHINKPFREDDDPAAEGEQSNEKQIDKKNGPSDADVQSKAWEIYKEHWNGLSSKEQDKVYRALGYDPDNMEKATSAISRHQRVRSGKPYYAGHGAIKPPRGTREAPVLEDENPLGMPEDLWDALKDFKEDGMSYKTMVDGLLDTKAGRKWFQNQYQGNEFDLRQDIEEAFDPEEENLEKARTHGAKDRQKRKHKEHYETFTPRKSRSKRSTIPDIDKYDELVGASARDLAAVTQELKDDLAAGNIDKEYYNDKKAVIKQILKQIYGEDAFNKAVATKPVSRHTRMRAGKPYSAGRGVISNKMKAPAVLDTESPEEVRDAELDAIKHYTGGRPEWNEKSVFIKSKGPWKKGKKGSQEDKDIYAELATKFGKHGKPSTKTTREVPALGVVGTYLQKKGYSGRQAETIANKYLGYEDLNKAIKLPKVKQ